MNFLGQIDAALGRKEDAVREGEHAVELLPPSKDALNGGLMMHRLARIYAQTGDANRAINFLQKIITLPNGLSYGTLSTSSRTRIPFASDPRFEQIVASLAPKDAAPK